MSDVSITVLDGASPAIKKLASSMKDFREPLSTMALVLDRSFKRQFKASGKPKWKPLSPITVFYRRNHSNKPLIDTGRLMRSYTARTSDGIYNLMSKQLTIGSNLSYAALHQYGGETELQEKRWFKKGKKAVGERLVDEETIKRITREGGKLKGFILKVDQDDMNKVKFYRKARKGTSDKLVSVPGYTKTGNVSKRFILKEINKKITIKVPARPVSIQKPDIAVFKTILERWIRRQAQT